MPELVLVVPRAQLFSSGEFYGLRHEGLADHLHLIEMHALFALRDQVEDNPSLKQIIPYVVLRHQDRLFLTHRTRQGTDPRLHEKYSIGLGGHINPSDGGETTDRLTAGMERELAEEVTLPAGWHAIPIGVFNNDLDDVERVHFGVVYLADVPSVDVRIRESSKLTGGFARWEEIYAVYSYLEPWSKLVIDGINLFDNTTRTA